MRFFQMKWIVPLILLAAFYVGDQIRLGRPDHKYRLTVEVATPDGPKSASGVLSVRPNRGYGGSGFGSSSPQTSGDALFVDLSGDKNLVALLVTRAGDFEDVSFIPMRALSTENKRVQFRDMKTLAGSPPVKLPDDQLPMFVTFANPANPGSARRIEPGNIAATFGEGYRLQSVSIAVIPNGYWPLDFGGAMGEPVTRMVASRLPWLRTPNGAATALQAAGIKVPEGFTAEAAFAR